LFVATEADNNNQQRTTDNEPMMKGRPVAVRIRMKRLGRKHRSYFRIVAIDSRQPRDGRIIEELGAYDPTIKNTDERVRLNPDRIKYWLSVGAKPSEKVEILFKKYMTKFEQQGAAAGPAPAAQAPAPSA
jgi:small subunit ribosomal protein S16